MIYQFHKIATSCKFHNYAQVPRLIVIEGLPKANNVLIVDWGEYSDLIECIFFLFLLDASHPNLLKCIDLIIEFTTNLIDLSEGALAYLFDYLKIFDIA